MIRVTFDCMASECDGHHEIELELQGLSSRQVGVIFRSVDAFGKETTVECQSVDRHTLIEAVKSFERATSNRP